MRHKQQILACSLLLVTTALTDRAIAQPYEIREGESTISFGGDVVTSLDHPNSFAIIGQTLVGRIASEDYIIELGLLSICNPPPPFTNIFWNAGAGNWNLAGNWSPNDNFPNNDGNATYVVHITNAGNDDVVTLNTTVNITQLNIGAGAILQAVNGTTRTITFVPSPITNANNFGIMRVTNVSSSRIFQLTDMKLNQIPASGTPGEMRAIAPTDATTATLRLVNSRIVGGTVIADGPGATVEVLNSSDLVIFDAGEFQAINGGTLDILTRVGGAAEYVTSGPSEINLGGAVAGAVSIGTGMTGQSVEIGEGGSLKIDGLAAGDIDYTATFAGDAVFTGSPPSWGSSPPVLNIGPRGRLSTASISFLNEAGVELAGESLITVSGNWNNLSTGTEFNSDMGSVVLNGPPGVPPALQAFELAGRDLGFSDDGFEDNFSLLSLEIGENRIVRFEDTFSNSPPPPVGCGETLYVEELVFGSGAQITADCGKVYYNTSAGSGTGYSVTFLNGGYIAYIGLAGDINGDGVTNASDVSGFIGALQLGMTANPDAFFRADLNHDGKVDGLDVQLFVDAVIPG